jgi:predicted TIM-barrel fold metal-dependent hydrolase
VAIKFEAAYLRSLDFEIVGLDAANSLYARFAGGGTIPNRDDYLRLQDAIFRRIALEAGRLKLPVHIHTGTGCGSYFDLRGSDPLLLDSILNDPALRNTVFVLVHGGSGPFTKQAAFQIGKPNVYLDFSEQDWALSARTMSVVLRDYLEAFPEKVLFGTDLFPGPPEMDWEVIGWQINATAREALAMALTSMIRDNEITREHALQLARMVLRENAIKLYGLK